MSEGEPACGPEASDSCYDKVTAAHLKGSAIAVIFIASMLGVLIPLIGRRNRFLRSDGNAFFIMKAFAAGVILATAFVHMLPAGSSALTSSCLPEKPWGKFVWSEFIAMLAILATLILDIVATEFYMNRHGIQTGGVDKVGDVTDAAEKQIPGQVMPHPHVHDHEEDSVFTNVRHIVVAQVFEFGIAAHSIIIGVTVGVSNSPCVIRPLFAALTFHQFFEGVALGGCVVQAGFRNVTSVVMGLVFAVTTPLGIAIGMGIASSYNENSTQALIVQGVFGSVSGGILIYMSLVDLIAADFLSKRMRSSRKLHVGAFIALFLGVGCMSVIGLWA